MSSSANQLSGPKRYRMTIAYDGSAYAGWQVQPGHVTVQETLQQAIEAVIRGVPAVIHACSRTDQGVHARGQTIHVDLPHTAPEPERFLCAVNAGLPPDIRAMAARQVSLRFHARFNAEGKEYRYGIWNGEILPPDKRLYRAWIRHPLDVSDMQTAANALIGTHDFAAFSANPNRPIESTVRTITRITVRRRGPEILITLRADGFLYKMVRSIVGLLMRVGEGAVPPAIASEILKSRIRTARVPTAPPQGLFLWRVYY